MNFGGGTEGHTCVNVPRGGCMLQLKGLQQKLAQCSPSHGSEFLESCEVGADVVLLLIYFKASSAFPPYVSQFLSPGSVSVQIFCSHYVSICMQTIANRTITNYLHT